MAGCSTHNTYHMEPGDDIEDAGQLQRLSDTIREHISDITNAVDRTLEEPSAKTSTLKSLYESAQQTQTSIVQLDNLIRNLLDLEDYTKEYEELDVYFTMILRTNWLLKREIIERWLRQHSDYKPARQERESFLENS